MMAIYVLQLIKWAIPEFRRTPHKEKKTSQKNNSHFILGFPKILITFSVTRVKKTWQFPKLWLHLVHNMGISNIFYNFWNYHF